MHTRPTLACLSIALAALLAGSNAGGAGPVLRVDGTFQIHDAFTPANRTGGETAPVLASWDWNGGFIATWLNYRSATDQRAFVGFYSIYGDPIYPGPTQLGSAQGPTSGIPSASAGPVAFPDGTSLIFFSSDRRGAPAAAKRDLFAQRMTGGSISPVGLPLAANSALANAQDTLLAARLSNGNALLAFVSHATAAGSFDIKGRVLNKNGAGVTVDKPITVNTTGAQTPTALSPFRAQGRSVLSYVVQTGQTRRYFVQRLDPAAARIGNPLLVKTTNGAATFGSVGVAGLSNGRFIAVWFQPGATAGTASLKARIFSAAGQPGALLTIGTAKIDNTGIVAPKIAVRSDGQMAVVTAGLKNGTRSIQAWLLDSAAKRVAGPVNVATSRNRLTLESLVVLANGSFVTSWTEAAAQLTATRAMAGRFSIFTCGRC